ncbi:helix-turn-helix domain-containing protein [Amycolatopsis sp. lyj-108]|uniref:helix-turn-helix domain-containing protein n=1 Tax=Amycolatopsis sp. lyj-108 TaxID=2789286 RepID=UPI00397951C9
MPKTPKDPGSESLAELGKRIKARRAELGISQERLGLRVGLHWTMIGHVERGKRNVSVLNLLKIAYGLELDAGALVAGLPVPPIEEKPVW